MISLSKKKKKKSKEEEWLHVQSFKNQKIGTVPLLRGVNARSSNLRRLLSSIFPSTSIYPHPPLVVFSSGRGARVRRDCAVSATEFIDMENPFFREKKRTRSRGRDRHVIIHRVPASQRENLACFFSFSSSLFINLPTFFLLLFWARIEDKVDNLSTAGTRILDGLINFADCGVDRGGKK